MDGFVELPLTLGPSAQSLIALIMAGSPLDSAALALQNAMTVEAAVDAALLLHRTLDELGGVSSGWNRDVHNSSITVMDWGRAISYAFALVLKSQFSSFALEVLFSSSSLFPFFFLLMFWHLRECRNWM